MATTIQISEELQKALSKRKMYSKETYEDVIWNILEDTLELSDETKRDIVLAEKQFKEGKYHTFDALKTKLGWK